MVADTVEAVIGAAFLDANENGLEVASSIMDKLGLNTHALLTVKFRDFPAP